MSMSWYSDETLGRCECVVWTCYCYVFWANCGYRGSRWYAHENLVNCVEGDNMQVSQKSWNWSLITASGYDHQFVGQWNVTDRYVDPCTDNSARDNSLMDNSHRDNSPIKYCFSLEFKNL